MAFSRLILKNLVRQGARTRLTALGIMTVVALAFSLLMSVLTPMQWSGERNIDVSTAPKGSLTTLVSSKARSATKR